MIKLEYLLTQIEYVKYLKNADTRTCRLSRPIKRRHRGFKQAQDKKKRLRIERARVFTHPNGICEISQERRHADLSSLQAQQTTL